MTEKRCAGINTRYICLKEVSVFYRGVHLIEVSIKRELTVHYGS